MSRVRSIASAALLALALMGATGARVCAGGENCPGGCSRSDVVVTVKFFDGWTRPVLGALDCRGKLRIVGAYSDTTSILASVIPDSAVAIIDKLLALDFYGQPEVYETRRFHAEPCGPDLIDVTKEETVDGGSAEVELHLGPHHHRVKLRYPAYGAPQALRDWVQEFRGLVKSNASWALQ